MSASQSNLSSPDYGYDYVLAVTQDSINATAIAFLAKNQPIVNVCYVYDDQGAPKRIDYAEFKKSAGGVDPFNIPAADPERTAAIKQLDGAGFYFGFQAALGLPAGFDVGSLPPIVTLGKTANDPVEYRLLCRSIVLVELRQIPHKPPVYVSQAQPKGPGGEPWIFTYLVDLIHQPVTDVKNFIASPGFASLPETAQNKVAGNPDAFSIRQLIYDFDRAACKVRPDITGVSGLLLEELYAHFSSEYFAQMQAAGAAVVALVPKSNDPLANLKSEFSINAYPSQPGLACVNYLCASEGHQLPPPKSFAWNWIDASERVPGEEPFDGVCVVNRFLLATHLRDQLQGYFERNKWVPEPVFIKPDGTNFSCGFGVTPRDWDWHGSPPDNLHIDRELFGCPAAAAGEVLVEGQFKASREYKHAFDLWIRGETNFGLTVRCRGSQVIVEQHALVYCKLVMTLFDEHEWNLVDLKLTDTFTLSTSHDGRLVVDRKSSTEDHSAGIGDDIVSNLKSAFTTVQSGIKERIQSASVDIPLSIFDTVVFPGGRSFLFKAVALSDHQDLITHITYSDPH